MDFLEEARKWAAEHTLTGTQPGQTQNELRAYHASTAQAVTTTAFTNSDAITTAFTDSDIRTHSLVTSAPPLITTTGTPQPPPAVVRLAGLGAAFPTYDGAIAQIHFLQAAIYEQQVRAEAAEAKCVTLEQALERYAQQGAALEGQLEHLGSAVKDELVKMSDEADSAHERVTYLEQQLLESRSIIHSLTAALGTSQSQTMEHSNTMEALRHQVDQLAASGVGSSNARHSSSAQHQQLQLVQQQRDEVLARVRSLETRLAMDAAGYQTEVERLTRENTSLSVSLRGAQYELSEALKRQSEHVCTWPGVSTNLSPPASQYVYPASTANTVHAPVAVAVNNSTGSSTAFESAPMPPSQRHYVATLSPQAPAPLPASPTKTATGTGTGGGSIRSPSPQRWLLQQQQQQEQPAWSSAGAVGVHDVSPQSHTSPSGGSATGLAHPPSSPIRSETWRESFTTGLSRGMTQTSSSSGGGGATLIPSDTSEVLPHSCVAVMLPSAHEEHDDVGNATGVRVEGDEGGGCIRVIDRGTQRTFRFDRVTHGSDDGAASEPGWSAADSVVRAVASSVMTSKPTHGAVILLSPPSRSEEHMRLLCVRAVRHLFADLVAVSTVGSSSGGGGGTSISLSLLDVHNGVIRDALAVRKGPEGDSSLSGQRFTAPCLNGSTSPTATGGSAKPALATRVEVTNENDAELVIRTGLKSRGLLYNGGGGLDRSGSQPYSGAIVVALRVARRDEAGRPLSPSKLFLVLPAIPAWVASSFITSADGAERSSAQRDAAHASRTLYALGTALKCCRRLRQGEAFRSEGDCASTHSQLNAVLSSCVRDSALTQLLADALTPDGTTVVLARIPAVLPFASDADFIPAVLMCDDIVGSQHGAEGRPGNVSYVSAQGSSGVDVSGSTHPSASAYPPPPASEASLLIPRALFQQHTGGDANAARESGPAQNGAYGLNASFRSAVSAGIYSGGHVGVSVPQVPLFAPPRLGGRRRGSLSRGFYLSVGASPEELQAAFQEEDERERDKSRGRGGRYLPQGDGDDGGKSGSGSNRNDRARSSSQPRRSSVSSQQSGPSASASLTQGQGQDGTVRRRRSSTTTSKASGGHGGGRSLIIVDDPAAAAYAAHPSTRRASIDKERLVRAYGARGSDPSAVHSVFIPLSEYVAAGGPEAASRSLASPEIGRSRRSSFTGTDTEATGDASRGKGRVLQVHATSSTSARVRTHTNTRQSRGSSVSGDVGMGNVKSRTASRSRGHSNTSLHAGGNTSRHAGGTITSAPMAVLSSTTEQVRQVAREHAKRRLSASSSYRPADTGLSSGVSGREHPATSTTSRASKDGATTSRSTAAAASQLSALDSAIAAEMAAEEADRISFQPRMSAGASGDSEAASPSLRQHHANGYPPGSDSNGTVGVGNEDALSGDPVPGMRSLLELLARKGVALDFGALLECFIAADGDKVGRVDDSAFAYTLRKFAKQLSWGEVEALVRNMCLEGCTSIDYVDFVNALSALASTG